ncbi:MAG: DHS-like NAD/FAD-binding domain-containing protein [Piptocephalis tieghemiana]|nr:MAG: DHS-like NAD/FAD-binding domain-containing protein [Piptocephalis tieghemiana]
MPPPLTTPVHAGTPRQLADFILRHAGKLTFLSGAGASTDSGIPDYRGPQGVYTRNPNYKAMYYQTFVTSHSARQRYWARSFIGWPMMVHAKPNPTHRILRQWQHQGILMDTAITQNVDGLHQDGPRHHVIELHGRLSKVRCLGCGHLLDRSEYQEHLAHLNPAYVEYEARLRELQMDGTTPISRTPDGDVELVQRDVEKDRGFTSFRYPHCPSCNTGILKPDVVFFGENLRPETTRKVGTLVQRVGAILVVGSSLAVPSARRIVQAVVHQGGGGGGGNHGSTPLDAQAHVRGGGGGSLALTEINVLLQGRGGGGGG